MVSKHLMNDLQGMLRGLSMIRASQASLPSQRTILPTRRVSKALREAIEKEQQKQAFLAQDKADQIRFEQEMIKMQMEARRAETQSQEPIVEEQQPIAKQEEAKEEATSEQTKAQNNASAAASQDEQDSSKSSAFGQTQQQASVASTDDFFFMRQDRPKFSAQERYVPSSKTSRVFHFGMLGVQLIAGTASEAIKQKVGLQSEKDYQQGKSGIAKYALNERNANRLAESFRKMRGAALKIGQILSTSEESVLPPIMREAMEKARSEADIMPIKQVVRIFETAYGADWQKNFKEINLYPFAAASIGQVHEAVLTDGTRVALKVQYTGIANSIDSDLDNFKMLVDVLGVFPRGLYLDELIKVSRSELHDECDYKREAEYQIKYHNACIVSPEKYYAPRVIEHMSNKEILCTEFVDGVEIDTLMQEPQEVRDRVGALMLELCFRELFEWKVMQTDPNPANYLYEKDIGKLNLLDFGAGRDFSDEFLGDYIEVIHGSYMSDKDKIIDNSLKLGFLTGEENKEMINAHYTGVMIVGEPFRTPTSDDLYNFGTADFTEKVVKILPTMSKHRLTPPPQQVYSLHKKVVGTYLMCIKLKANVPARRIFEETYENWKRLQRNEPLIPR